MNGLSPCLFSKISCGCLPILAAIARGTGDVAATVTRIEHLGDQSHLHLDLRGQPIVTLSDPEAELGAGDVVSLRLNNPLFFDAAGGRLAA